MSATELVRPADPLCGDDRTPECRFVEVSRLPPAGSGVGRTPYRRAAGVRRPNLGVSRLSRLGIRAAGTPFRRRAAVRRPNLGGVPAVPGESVTIADACACACAHPHVTCDSRQITRDSRDTKLKPSKTGGRRPLPGSRVSRPPDFPAGTPGTPRDSAASRPLAVEQVTCLPPLLAGAAGTPQRIYTLGGWSEWQ